MVDRGTRVDGSRPPAAFAGTIGIAIVLLAGLVISTIGRGMPFGLDQGWYDVLADHRLPFADAAAGILNIVGGTLAMTLVTVVVVIGLAVRRHVRAAASVALTIAVASGISSLVKIGVARPRPPDGIVATASDSFPSGHTTTAAALTIALLIVFPHVWARVLAALWVPIMALSRTYLLVHWLSDVVAGALLGASVALVVSASVRSVAESGWYRSRILKEPSPDSTAITG